MTNPNHQTMENEITGLPLRPQVREKSIIKVVGVGGGGCNAVNYMYRQGIHAVTFLVCNTDAMALEQMDVPHKLQIGPGLGAGGRPQVAEDFATNSEEQIKEALSDNTRMVFITAGMGGGTGTGASPIVAKVAHEMGILTVGIVTIPFAFEGKKAITRAMRGVARLAQYTDALLVINNEKLKLLFPDFDLPNAFQKADEVLCNAAKSIAEIITVPGYINTDFQDVYNTLKDGNVAIMNVGSADGDNRITQAINNALDSPIVNTNNVSGASRILLNFYCSKDHAIRMEELQQVQDFCDSVGDEVDVKWGASYDDSLGEEVKVTIIATGYKVTDIPGLEAAVQSDEKAEEVPVKQQSTTPIEDAIEKAYGNLKGMSKEEEKEEQEDKPKEEEKQEEAKAEQQAEEEKQEVPVIDFASEQDKEGERQEEQSEGQEKPERPRIPFNFNRPQDKDSEIILFDDLDDDTDEISKKEDDVPAWMRRR